MQPAFRPRRGPAAPKEELVREAEALSMEDVLSALVSANAQLADSERRLDELRSQMQYQMNRQNDLQDVRVAYELVLLRLLQLQLPDDHPYKTEPLT